MKPIWWARTHNGSELELYQRWTRRGNRVFESNSSIQLQILPSFNYAMPTSDKSGEQAETIPIPTICLELDNIDALTPYPKNVISPRHSNLRSIRNLKGKSNKSTHLIFVPASLLKVGIDAFYESQLKYLIFARNAQITFIDQHAFGKANLHSLHIPPSVEKFGNHVLSISHIKSITFPSTSKLKEIPSWTFHGCPNLSSIEIPTSVGRIEQYAFSGSNLESITFHPNSELQYIGICSFYDCPHLISIEVPSSVQVIECNAFRFSSCQSITFAPNSQLETIGKGAFGSLRNLHSLNIPSSVKEIGEEAFSFAGLQSISFGANSSGSNTSGANSKLKKFSKELFEGCPKLKLIEIPATIEEIDKSAFYRSAVELVTFAPDSRLKSIGADAFKDCYNLSSVCFPSS